MPKQTLVFESPVQLSVQYATGVLSGDSSNREGLAAQYYWRELFGKEFIRDRFGEHPNDFLNYGYTLLRAATAPNRQYNRAPLHGLPAERHGQGVPGNLQPFRQYQGSEKMAQIPEFYPIFLIFLASNCLRTRIK